MDEQPVGRVDESAGEATEFRSGFTLKVDAKQDAVVRQAGAAVIAAGHNIEMAGVGGLLIASGRDMSASNSFSPVTVVGYNMKMFNCTVLGMNVGGNAELANATTLVSASKAVHARNSSIGLVLAGKVELGEGARVLLNTKQAAAWGIVFGAVFALLNWLLRLKTPGK